MNACRKIRVEGRVQGVFFRAFTQKAALELGLKGWVRNETDGSVLLIACGEAAQLDELVTALHRGPAAAEVTHLQTEALAYQSFEDFIIQR